MALVIHHMACQPRINERGCGEGKLQAADGSFRQRGLVRAKAAVDRRCRLDDRDKLRCTFRDEDKSTYHDVMCARSHASARLDSIAKQASDLVYVGANGRRRRSRVELCILLKQ